MSRYALSVERSGPRGVGKELCGVEKRGKRGNRKGREKTRGRRKGVGQVEGGPGLWTVDSAV